MSVPIVSEKATRPRSMRSHECSGWLNTDTSIRAGLRIVITTQNRASQPRTPFKREFLGAALASWGAAAAASDSGLGDTCIGSFNFAGLPQTGQISDSGIDSPHLAQNICPCPFSHARRVILLLNTQTPPWPSASVRPSPSSSSRRTSHARQPACIHRAAGS